MLKWSSGGGRSASWGGGPAQRGCDPHRGDAMARALKEILAYSCMAVFITGFVVLAAATFI